MKKNSRFAGFYMGLIFFLMYLPIAVVIVFSFNESKLPVKFTGFSLKWYQELIHDRAMLEALVNSLILGVLSCLVSAVIGTLGAVGLSRIHWKSKGALEYISILPLMIPEIILGMVLMAFFYMLNLPFGMLTLLITLSSAVGLGNIWMFPYVVGQNGGAAFIIVYLGCVLLIGLPTLISEFVVGRGTRKNVCGAISKVTDKRRFKLIGYIAVLSTSCMLFFYTVVAGWVYSYVFKALFGVLKGVTAEEAAQIFNSTSLGPISPIIWQLIVLVVAGSILGLGVKSGIEKLTKVLMPILMGLLILCVLTSLTLPGAYSGIEFLLKPDFSKVTVGVILSALGLAFFKLSVGTGTMVTYGSYFTEDNEEIPSWLIIHL